MIQRLEKLQKWVREQQLAALIVDNPVDLLYLTGKKLSLGRLVVSETEAALFVDGRYFDYCQDLPFLTKLTAGYGKESVFSKWWPFEQKKVGFDSIYTSYASFEALKELPSELVPLKQPILRIRGIKEEKEIEKLKLAAALGSIGFDFVLSLLREGISEKEVASEIEIFWLKSGGDRLAFAPHIAFSEGSSFPHYHSGSRKLKKGDLVLIDIGVVLDQYHSDMTRVIAFGNPTEEMQKIYSIVFEAYNAAVNICSPGVKIRELDLAARDLIASYGYKENFSHSLGHGVGLEIHELPRIHSSGQDSDQSLEKGMVITIEPGVYLSNQFGVRLEDTFVVTDSGCENITNRPLSPKIPML